MEVWILERYYPDEGISETLAVFENADVGMKSIDPFGIIWTNHISYWISNKVDDMIYHLVKFQVILDEVPRN